VSRPWILLPVYNAVDDLRECLASLSRTLRPDDTVLLADDASPDPRIPPLLDEWTAGTPLQVRRTRRPVNLGFVGNVNAAMDEAGDADVVLLNSDTLVTPGWLDAIERCAALDPRIATATPWSNNAEICSFPALCRAAPLPTPPELSALAVAVAGLADVSPPELPTGVGFAMYIRRQAWRELGGFDAATFGRGYGEENDFCQRAARHGWRNVLCPSAYVAHRGHASFAETGLQPGGENLARLCARYPDYTTQVAQFIEADPLRPLRERLSALLP